MKKIIIAVVVVLLIAGAFFAGKWFWQDNNQSEDTQTAQTQALSDHYFAMERFIISIGNDKATRYLVLDLNLVFPENAKNIADATQYTPILRNVLVKQFANLNHKQAKAMFEDIDQVQSQLLDNFNLALKEKSSLVLSGVLITNVFIQ